MPPPPSSLDDSPSRREPLNGINVTPFVDVMLVLLVIFMVSAPLLEQGVDIDLPEADAPTLEADPEISLISVSGDRTIRLDGQRLENAQDLRRALDRRRQSRTGAPTVRIQADADLPYGFVVDLLAAAQKAGVRGIDLVTAPPSDSRP